jgi:hypothetical protein
VCTVREERGQGGSVRTVRGLLPLLVAVIAVLWLGTRFRVVMGLFLIGHGLVHAMFVFPEPQRKPDAQEWPFRLDRSWILSRLGLGSPALRPVGIVLVAVCVVGLAAGGIGLLLDTGWWELITVVGTVSSLLLLSLYFQISLVLGLLIDAFLLTLLLLGWPSVGFVTG